MVKPCKYCGAELPEGRNFCLACGKVQSAVPVTVPSPRRRLRLILPALILAALIACTPLLPLLQRQRAADPAEIADTAQTDPGAPGRDGGGQEDGGEQAVAPDDHPPAYGTPAEKENGEDTKNAGETASSVSPAPAYTAPAVSQPAPTPSPEPEPEPEPTFAEGSYEQLSYWLQYAPRVSPSLILTPGVTYCARQYREDSVHVLFLRMTDGAWSTVYYGTLIYLDHSGSESDGCLHPDFNTDFDGVTYHFTSLAVSNQDACGLEPEEGRYLLYFGRPGGGAVVERYGSGTPYPDHYGTDEFLNGLPSANVSSFRYAGLTPCYDPGILAAADYAIDVRLGNA